MTWLLVGALAAVVFGALVVMGVLAERCPDPAPERDIGAVELPAVRDELALRDLQLERHQRRERVSRYRNDRGDQ
ncbi:hypothetical protein SK571_13615 [Lentzea sp. BCCO 10_0798]|uniref:Uncharacterized protein n=1 Tax=Lentzea kristufekii TaxID=3095430 RepID=A0ABU4TQ55_9PSEU|nr:hypothetical protein [Lentzea sp. BCCO 10_0798]MDX8050424.1 hypothetical protein [Lentzea sp. BCCO 10_0798]